MNPDITKAWAARKQTWLWQCLAVSECEHRHYMLERLWVIEHTCALSVIRWPAPLHWSVIGIWVWVFSGGIGNNMSSGAGNRCILVIRVVVKSGHMDACMTSNYSFIVPHSLSNMRIQTSYLHKSLIKDTNQNDVLMNLFMCLINNGLLWK